MAEHPLKVRFMFTSEGDLFAVYIDGHVDLKAATDAIHAEVVGVYDDEGIRDHFPDGIPEAQHLWLRNTGETDDDSVRIHDWCAADAAGAYPVTAIDGGEPL